MTDASGRGVELWFRAAPGEIAAFRAALHTGGGLRVAEERIAERPPVHPGGAASTSPTNWPPLPVSWHSRWPP
ncbi:hypothetical protein LV779_19240 [Streptomyces thinghirensis]|nr:hypothetical protein [Streptomyces thinghirensis]